MGYFLWRIMTIYPQGHQIVCIDKVYTYQYQDLWLPQPYPIAKAGQYCNFALPNTLFT